jgi:hypothetical protein
MTAFSSLRDGSAIRVQTRQAKATENSTRRRVGAAPQQSTGGGMAAPPGKINAGISAVESFEIDSTSSFVITGAHLSERVASLPSFI